MKRLLSQIAAAILGLWLAILFVPSVIIRAYPTSNFFGFPLTTQWEIILVLGIALGLLNYFLRPLLKALFLPLEIITLGLFTIVIDMGLIWLLDKMFDEFYVPFLLPLLYTTLIIWGLNLIGIFLTKNKYK
ncbi:MAG: phage holin family protein [Candidatus Staskawiczbacteria bacterium]|nr:phage holin family protein [Candidatus Staskawiczbacteria bacterium]